MTETRTRRAARRPRTEPAADDSNFEANAEEGGEETTTRRRSASRPSRRAAPEAHGDEDVPRGRRGNRDSDDGDDEPAGTLQGGWGSWRQRRAETSSFADDFKVEYKEKYLIMFLDKEPFVSYTEHWIDEMPKGKKKSYVCIGKKADCPLCKALGEKPSARAMFNILEFIKTDDGQEAVHKVWTVGSGVAQEIEEYDEDPGLEGNYFRVSKSKSGRNGPTKYTVVPVKDRDVEEDWKMSLLSDDEYDKAFENRFTKDYVKMPTRKELQDIAEEVLALDD